MSAPRLTKALVREALEKNGGLRTQAANALGVTPAAVSHWLKKHPDLAKVREDNLAQLTDVAEGNLFKAIQAGDMKWTQYFLDHHARGRGYGQKLQLTGKNDAPLFDPAGMAQFLGGLTDEQRKAFDTLRAGPGADRPDGVASLEPSAG